MKHWIQQNIADLTVEELVSGVRSDTRSHRCVICGQPFQEGIIYRSRDDLVTARTAAERHIQDEHGGTLTALLDLPRQVTGLSETQQSLIRLMAEGVSDRDIARQMDGKAESTIRSHRFQLRKRIGEAKVLVALGDLLSRDRDSASDFLTFHHDIPNADDRVIITTREAQEIEGRLFSSKAPLRLAKFPKKQKEKLVVLKRIAAEFEPSREYAEAEINDVIGAIYEDYVTIRRYLVDYRFLDRKADGSRYWTHGGT